MGVPGAVSSAMTCGCVLAHDAAPEMVDEAIRGVLPPVSVSLSKQLEAGVTTFSAMGMELAYTGDPASASVEEGERMIQRLAEMVVGEVREALGLPSLVG